MQALNDEQHIAAVEAKVDRLEGKVDDGFVRMEAKIDRSTKELRGEIVAARSDARSDFRTLIAVTFAMWVTTILCVVGVFLQQHL